MGSGGADVAAAPEVSVVVATYRRPALLARLIEALDGQQVVAPFEVIVVDDDSPDATWATLTRLAEEHPRIRPMRTPANGGPARARNLGWRAARAPLVAFTDDDCVPEPGWLAGLVAGAAEADVVQGRVRPDPDQLARRGPFSRTLEVEGLSHYQTCNLAYRRSLLESLGGFDERFRGGEDTELGLRAKAAGARAVFAPDAVVRHDVSPSDLGAHLRSLDRWGEIPLVVGLHPEARALLHTRLWWKASHRPALAAGAGVALAAASLLRRRPLGVLAGTALCLPYASYRTRRHPLGRSRAESVSVIPAALLADLVEVAVVARGAIRHRTLVL